MSSAENGAGSHFAPSGSGRAPRAGARGSEGPAGGATRPPQRPDDTLQSIFSLPLDPPNGSHATNSAPFEPVAANRPASPSDTDVFLAVAAQSQAQQAARQPSLTPASRPVSSGAPQQPARPAASPYGSAAAPDVTSVYAPAAQRPAPQQASAETTGSLPANPLVAARNARSTSAASGGLFPIQETSQTGRSFDMSFGEPNRKRTVLIAVVAVVVVALVAVGVFFGLRYKQAADARADIDEAINILRTTDDVIVPLDSAIAADISSGVASGSLSNLMLQSTTTSNNLTSAEQLATSASGARDLLSDDEGEALDAVTASIAARRSMLEVGRQLLSADTSIGAALDNLEAAYNSINEANTNVQSARDTYNAYSEALAAGGDTSAYSLQAVVDADNAAVNAVTAAQNSVAAAKEAFPSVDLSALDNYLAARLNHVNLLLQFDTAMLNGDPDGANALLDQINQADAAQQEAATLVPATAAELLTGAYATATADQREAYDSARDACVAADEVLNGYLGITDASKEMGLSASSSAPAAATADAAAVTDVAAADAGDATAADPAAEGADPNADPNSAADPNADPNAAVDPNAAAPEGEAQPQ